MRKFHRKNSTACALALCLLNLLWVFPALAQDQSSTSQAGATNSEASSPTTKEKKKKKSKPVESQPTNNGTTGDRTASAAATSSVAKQSSGSPSGAASESDIAAAKASGKVWVNLDSGIYHKGGRWYGKTKNGRFMTEKEAKAAGYKPAQRN